MLYIRTYPINLLAVQYTINKSKLLFGFVGAEWKQGVVAELDSALNEWISGVPPHCSYSAFS